jgi:mannose-6-phosphate isomerase-like protein (cupin superfamily)
MTTQNPNLAMWHAGSETEDSKAFLAQPLGLTGTEISRTVHRPGGGSTFVHAHRRNEEVYIVAQGHGWLYLDGEEIAIREGDVFRISPDGKRAVRAADDSSLVYYCIQADAGSLVQATRNDGYLSDERASWMKA